MIINICGLTGRVLKAKQINVARPLISLSVIIILHIKIVAFSAKKKKREKHSMIEY